MSAGAVDPTHRTFISYIDRTREYYAALGYEQPYAWSYYDEVPFAPLAKPLAESRVGLVTTASPLRLEKEKTPQAVWSGAVEPPPERLYTGDRAWDRDNTHTDDRETFLPIRRVQEWIAAGRVGSLAEHFVGVPTEYSQRRTIERDAPEVERLLREDGVDVALLVPL